MKKLDPRVGLEALKSLINDRSLLGPLEVMAKYEGRFFQIPLPGFSPKVVWGHKNVREVLTNSSSSFLWRNNDPVRDVLNNGVLVTDGEIHDHYRGLMEPSLRGTELAKHKEMMVAKTIQVSEMWPENTPIDMLVEGRKIALLIVYQALFGVDIWGELPFIWDPILKAIQFISPGGWIFWRNIPRPGYKKAFRAIDQHLFKIIQDRKQAPKREDMLGTLLDAGLSDQDIRDQMLTMLIAGHDTSTALFAWVFVMLGQHPEVYQRLTQEIDASPEHEIPHYLEEVIRESLRLYPPIHIGNRIVKEEVCFGENAVMVQGDRAFLSIYLTHRDPEVWEEPTKFCPARFAKGSKQTAMSYIPFGGGKRSCIGSAFGLIEARETISYLLRNFHFEFLNSDRIKPKMGATLEPMPGVLVSVSRKGDPA